ncbi:MAG: von Willebrand factor type A domain-containing protein, partial [Bacteroidales bacterium]|nr:von Willebrand factor type A domain-containing protein [Bacteroidales bacterium]
MTKNLVLISVSLLLIFLSNCETESYLRSEADSYYSNFKSSESLRDGGEYTGENYQEYEENPFVKVLEQPLSTFSVDADGGAYSNMRRYFRSDLKPPVAAVRIEEFINYFTFDYEDPANGENISMNTEISTCPWNSDHHLLRIGIKGKSIPENELPATNFVFLIDVSGSMDSDDKLGILKSGFKRLTDNLTNKDRIAIVTYAGSVGVHLQSTT